MPTRCILSNKKMKRTYEERLYLPIDGLDEIIFFTKVGTPVAKGYTRVVIGGRGPYIEFTRKQIITANFIIPDEQKYRLQDKRVYYLEARSNDESNVKLYFQKRTVSYADYKIGMIYLSPFDLTSDKYPLLIEPLDRC
jgi:hypothetical protein